MQIDKKDLSYPLWHPYQSMNGIESQITMLVNGKGCRVRDQYGNDYIDASGGLWSVQFGLGNADIISAITDQLHRLSYGTLFEGRGNEPALALARELVSMAPVPLQWAYLTGSGSEAVEHSIKIARLFRALQGRHDKKEIIYLDQSYHGTFFGSMGVTALIEEKKEFEPLLPGLFSIPAPAPDRCPSGMSYLDFALSCAQALKKRASQGGVSAFIAEPVLGAAGVIVPPKEYFLMVQEICRQHDVLLILDEVATGFGRTVRWFAAEHFDLRPDILLLAKGINSGYLPLGAVLFSAEIGDMLKKASGIGHGSSHNGNPACCAAALATIQVMRREELVKRAAESGAYFRTRLEELRVYPCVKEIRSLGLMLAVVFAQADGKGATRAQVDNVCTALTRAGVLAYPGRSSLVFCPALVITLEEIDTIVECLHRVLADTPFEGNCRVQSRAVNDNPMIGERAGKTKNHRNARNRRFQLHWEADPLERCSRTCLDSKRVDIATRSPSVITIHLTFPF